MILARIFDSQSDGFYIDVGAHHPKRFSNTYYFYKRGWRGINVEPDSDAIASFNKSRPRDINIATGIADSPGKMTYHVFDEPALNSFDARLSAEREANTRYHIVERRTLEVMRLDELLRQHLPPGQDIDFLTVDVEGLDLPVIQSNDWNRYRPKCLLLECLDSNLEKIADSPSHKFLLGVGYVLFAKTFNTTFYLEGGWSRR